jgi:malate dehydrogenase (oxaloacetate-decarboxylating)(NADP+)
MNIPVFHDDQHGTAIICLAGIINVLEIKQMKIQVRQNFKPYKLTLFKNAKIVMVGAGAAGIACMEMVKNYGADPKKCFMLDTRGRYQSVH